jgi:hypothetical protein
MRQFFPGMLFQLPRNVCVGGALEHLAVHGVGNDRLVFPARSSFSSWIICSRVMFNSVVMFSLVING